MAININLLLKQEIKVVRAENKRKIKKKARRRARLGTNIFLSVQQGQDYIQQPEIQVQEEV